MQHPDELLVLVKTDLLLQEHGFNSLRNYVLTLDPYELELYDEFDFSPDENEIKTKRQLLRASYSYFNILCNKVKHGYILVSFSDLKKMLNIPLTSVKN